MTQTRNNFVTSLSKYTKIDVHTSVQSATPHRLIEMLLDGAMARIAVAQGQMERKETAAKGESISWAVTIIGGLRDSLNMDAGGMIAENLDALYDYMSRRLLEANLKNDTAALQEVHKLLSNIRSGWVGIKDNADALSAASSG